MDRKPDIKISVVDDGFMLLSWEGLIDDYINDQVIFKTDQLRALDHPSIDDIVPAYSSLAIYYDTLELSNAALEQIIRDLPSGESAIKNKPQVIEVPVCYDLEFGLDMEELCRMHSLSLEEIIDIHTAQEYRVYFIGFLPGFMYLGGLDKRIHSPRRRTPRAKVSAGAVGIGGSQTGVYPKDSPGGWNVIGQCPLVLFDAESETPCRFSAGDSIRFRSINKNEYFEIYNSEHP